MKYKINIRVLGLVRLRGDRIVFVPSHRRLPHVGSKIAFPSDEVLQEIAGHNLKGAEIGHLSFGEFIYSGDDPRVVADEWMQIRYPGCYTAVQYKKIWSPAVLLFLPGRVLESQTLISCSFPTFTNKLPQ